MEKASVKSPGYRVGGLGFQGLGSRDCSECLEVFRRRAYKSEGSSQVR